MNRKLRVLFLVPGPAEGHSMVFVRRQAEALARQGHHIESFDLRSRTSLSRMYHEFRRFRRLLRTFRPHIVHAQYGTATALFAALGHGKIPLVITYRGGDLNPAPSARGPRAKAALVLSQLAALRAARIVCVSHQLKNRLWWRRSIASVLPSGVDPDIFRPAPPRTLRSELGWRIEERVVLFHAGNDARNKRLDLARDTVEQARRWTPAVRLEVLDGRVPPARVPALMNAADCLLVTSDSEGSPSVVQEALATNLPVVSVDVGDVAERLEGVSNCCVVARDAEALGRALAGMLDPPRRSDGRRKAGQFSAAQIARDLARLYQDAIRERIR